MSASSAYLQFFDDAWSHAYESLAGGIEGVTEAEASWQAPAYASVAREEGWPAPGTIAWHVAHLTHCKRYYADVIRRRAEAESPEPRPWATPATFDALVGLLKEAHAEQRTAIEALEDDDLEVVIEGDRRLADFLSATIRHDIWHAAQIAMARRLAGSAG